jgi:GNAT superfamily N-acetyltransferase
MSLQVRPEAIDSSAGAALNDRLQLEYVERYGGPDSTPVDYREFAPPTGGFLVAYLGGVPAAMGGVRRHQPGVVEIKRMYVVPEVRGQGLARLMLGALEDLARELGGHRVVLETGSKQPEAVRLYETSGYSQIDGFGHHRCQRSSISYGKSLAGADALSG